MKDQQSSFKGSDYINSSDQYSSFQSDNLNLLRERDNYYRRTDGDTSSKCFTRSRNCCQDCLPKCGNLMKNRCFIDYTSESLEYTRMILNSFPFKSRCRIRENNRY